MPQSVAATGSTLVVVEHRVDTWVDHIDRVVVLDYGKKIGDGPPDEVKRNPAVIAAYLGTSH